MPFKKSASEPKQKGQEQAAQKQSQSSNSQLPSLRVKIDRPGSPDSSTLAYASVTIGGAYSIHGVKVMNSAKGPFVSMPCTAYKGPNGETKYAENFHPVTAEARNAINQAVSDAYSQYLAQEQSAAPAENAGMSQNM